MTTRAQFSSRFGFLMAAAGAAVGLGNVWSFPSMAANNGGGAFLIIYVIMAFVLAYPALMAELTLGRYAQSGIINAMTKVGGQGIKKHVGLGVGSLAVVTACLGQAFYAIVTGWLLKYTLAPFFDLIGLDSWAAGLTAGGFWTDWLFASLAMLICVSVVLRGVNKGIERWSKRLMPLLILLMLLLTVIFMTLPGASQGLSTYLVPDFSQVNGQLVMDAMGQAFFSLSIGVGAMAIYGSYLSRDTNLPRIGAQVMFIDMGVAFIAGLLIVPSMFVANNLGVNIFNDAGQVQSSATLLFDVMPAMFNELGSLGAALEVLFFALLAIAALTSMFPVLEVPVATVVETGVISRRPGTLLMGSLILAITTLILMYFDVLFGLAITFTITYSMPLIGAVTCLYVGWLLSRNVKLNELRQGAPDIEKSLFWKIWPWYIWAVCPALVLIVLFNSI
nr:sodium-dependent transporter [Halomonas halocynthiae]